MNKYLRILPLIAIFSQTAIAAADKTSNGDNNGKPFQELNAIIESNRTLIDANSAGIIELQTEVNIISNEVEAIQTDLSTLGDRISINENDIDALRVRVENSEGDISTLNSELAALRADHNADVAEINLAIVAAETSIANLQGALQTLTDNLNLRLGAIENDVEDNAIAIDSLLLELTTTSAKALSNMMAINALQGQVDDLLVRAAQHETDIASLQSQIDALDTRVSGLESLHNDNSCAVSTLWQPVDCTTTRWVWTSNRSFPSVDAADENQVLWVGDQHASIPNTCSLDGTGWVSTQVFTMAGCSDTWRHIGGFFSGLCGGHDGDQVRRLTKNPEGCFDYTAP